MVEDNASGCGLGAIFSQDSYPITYFSKALRVQGQSKPIYEKEFMAFVVVVLKWRHYLLGRHFVIWTDQHNLKYIMAYREVGVEYQRWITKLLGYDFEIKFKLGVNIKATCAFSGHPSLTFHNFSL